LRSSILAPILAALLALGSSCAPPAQQAEPAEDVRNFEAIQSSGELRVLLPGRVVVDQLPRGGLTLDGEQQLIEQFAIDQGLRYRPIPVDSREQLIPMLLAGEGDVIAANLTASEERLQRVRFSLPTAVVYEQLVGRDDDQYPTKNRTLHLRRSSSFWEAAQLLLEKHPTWKLKLAAENLETEEILHRVASGQFDFTIADSNLVEAVQKYDLPVKPLRDVTGERTIGFAIRPTGTELEDRLNRFLRSVQLRTEWNDRYSDDLGGLKGRRILRVLTRNTASSYFVWRGQLRGFDYELAKAFARDQNMRLEMVVPRPGESLYDLLREGRGDLVAASLIPPPERELEGVHFSRAYNYLSHLVVGRRGATPKTFKELVGRTIHLPRASPLWKLVSQLQSDFEFELRATPTGMKIDQVVRAVAAGTYDLTATDSQTLAIEQSWRDELEAGITLREKIPLSWAVREGNPQLLDEVNRFIKNTYRGLTYNVLYDRYFRDSRAMRSQLSQRTIRGGRLSPYDEIVRRYADEYGFDWRLIVAQMYQESRFDHGAQSFAGAQGLMQVMPQTAAQFDIDDMSDPESAILAGVRYLDWVYDQFDGILSVSDRMWFSLAAYNAGPGHVRDAQRLARQLGLNPRSWFGHVEHAMLLLSQDAYYSKAKHGYCRCSEPVRYVRDIQQRFNAYVDTLRDSG
jgi:membrane-bound lytic murein transglycosylase F